MTAYGASTSLRTISAGYQDCAAEHVDGPLGGPSTVAKERGAHSEHVTLQDIVIGARHLQRTGSLSVEPTGPRGDTSSPASMCSFARATPTTSLSSLYNREPLLSPSPGAQLGLVPLQPVASPDLASAAHQMTVAYEFSWAGGIIRVEPMYF